MRESCLLNNAYLNHLEDDYSIIDSYQADVRGMQAIKAGVLCRDQLSWLIPAVCQ